MGSSIKVVILSIVYIGILIGVSVPLISVLIQDIKFNPDRTITIKQEYFKKIVTKIGIAFGFFLFYLFMIFTFKHVH